MSVSCQRAGNKEDNDQIEQINPINTEPESNEMTIIEPSTVITVIPQPSEKAQVSNPQKDVPQTTGQQTGDTQIMDSQVGNSQIEDTQAGDSQAGDSQAEDSQIEDIQIVDTKSVNSQTDNTTINNSEEIFIEVYKEDRILKLWKGDLLQGEYPVGLGFHPVGHKEQEGDGKTPEGSYYVCVKNPNSRFYLSLGVSYPGISDAKKALSSDRITQSEYDSIISAINSGTSPPWNTPLGGEIMIHGNGSDSDWTAGCVAVDNDIMDILFEQCKVGTRIEIYP
jgi:L,D-peptidoglycan transpeptidase YkuD (ErfK/YbiS/YcfS/YnhG family)